MKKYLYLIVVVMVAYIAIIYINYTKNKEELLQNTKNNQIRLVHAYKSKIDSNLLSRKRIIQATANFINTKDRQKDYKLIKEVLALSIKDGDFESVYIGYHDEYFITGKNWIAPGWYKSTQRKWYQDVQKQKRIVVTKPYLDSDLNSDVISIATPIFKDDKLYAVLSSDIKIDDFENDILSLMPVKNSFAFLVTKDGDTLLNPSSKNIDIKNEFLIKIGKEFLGSKTQTKTFKINEKNYIFTYDFLEHSDWIFIAAISEDEIYKKLNNAIVMSTLATTSLLILGAFIFLYLYFVQKKLLQSRNFLNLFAKSSSWGVLMCDKFGEIVFLNKEFEDIFSLKHKKSYGQNIKDLPFKKSEKDLFAKEDFFQNIQNNGKKIKTYKLHVNSGIYNFQVTPLLKSDEIFEGIIITVNDISKEEKAQKDRIKQEKILLQNSKMISLGEMVGAISHQWRQPLSSLLLLVSGLEDKIKNNEIQNIENYLFRARNNIELMNETINVFSDFYKENMETAKSKFDVVNMVNKTIQIIKPTIRTKGIDIDFTYNKHETYLTNSFQTYLKQVLINLISNAKDALCEKIDTNIDFEAKISIILDKKDSKILIIVNDNGGGIGEGEKEMIFDPLFTTKGKNGTGLGLHLCRILIEDKIDGKIYLQNSANPTSFVIELKGETC